MIVYRRGAEDWLVCVNAGNRQKDFEWLRAGEGPGCAVKNESDDWAQIAIQGPKAAGIVQRLSKDDLLGVKTFHFRPAEVAGRLLHRRPDRLHRRGRLRALLPP